MQAIPRGSSLRDPQEANADHDVGNDSRRGVGAEGIERQRGDQGGTHRHQAEGAAARLTVGDVLALSAHHVAKYARQGDLQQDVDLLTAHDCYTRPMPSPLDAIAVSRARDSAA